MNGIKILLVEDDRDWTTAMVDFLDNEDDLYVVGTAETKQEAIDFCKRKKVDVVLMDINLGGTGVDGVYAASELCRLYGVKVIMLTSLHDKDIITSSYAAGAVNFIPKTHYREIPGAVRSTYKNTPPIEIILREYLALKEEQQLKELTAAEREVYELLEQGYTHTQIQKKLYKTENTLKVQIRNILRKIGAKSSKEAVEKVKMRGIDSV